MDRTSKLLLATGIAIFAGAMTGAVVGANPILDREGIGGAAFEPRHSQAVADLRIAELHRPVMPSHYAIETPQGRFGVGELRSRGLDRNRRASWYDRELAADMAEQERAIMEAHRNDATFIPDPLFADREWQKAGGRPTKAERFAARPGAVDETVERSTHVTSVDPTEPAVAVTRASPSGGPSADAQPSQPLEADQPVEVGAPVTD